MPSTSVPAIVTLRWLTLSPASDQLTPGWRALLDDDELERADRFRFDADRAQFIAAHALARTLLSSASQIPPGYLRYRTSDAGKPALIAPDHGAMTCFSLSHTSGLVACAVASGMELGLDVEALARDVAEAGRIATDFFSQAEAALIGQSHAEGRAELFLRLWTLKEAFIKGTGEGLARPLDSFSFSLDPVRLKVDGAEMASEWQFRELRPTPDHRLALAIGCGSAARVTLDAGAIIPQDIATDPAQVCSRV